MRLTLRHLIAFKTIVEQGTFRKSAEYLNISQPALSVTINSLEEELGTAVFDRTTRSVRLTAAGRELYSHLGPIFDRLHRAFVSTKDAAAGLGGSISISYIDFAILGPLPSILLRYRAVNPNVRVEISFANSLSQIERVHSGTVDVGFILDSGMALPKEIQRRTINSEGLLAVLPPDHHLADRKGIALNELADEDFIMGDAFWRYYNDMIRGMCLSHGFTPRIRQSALLRDELLSFVMAGLGVLVYPECIRKAPRFGLHMVPIEDVGPIVSTVAIWLAASTNPILPSLLELIPDRSETNSAQ